MAIADTNSTIRTYLVAQVPLTTIVGTKIYCPRVPENVAPPALGFFTRGGTSTPYIPGIVSPSVQFDCWGNNPIEARQVYLALYDVLQGIQNIVVGASVILSASEEVQGQDLQDVDIPNYYRVVTFFNMMIKAGI